MYLPGVLVATLVVLACAEGPPGTEQSPQGSSETPAQSTALVPVADQNEPPLKMSEFCFFGKFPSATCRFRCHLMRMEAFCEGAEVQVQTGEGKCKCRPETKPTEAPQEMFAKPETHKEQEAEKAKPAEGKPSVPTEFAIHMQTAPQEPEEDQQAHHVVFYVFDLNKIFGPQNGTKVEAELPQAVPGGWSFQHFVALLIILLLLVLISLEMYACYKKTIGKPNDMESIFKTIPMPNKA